MILLVGGQKGGTGKSTLATNIVATLRQRGHNVVLVDGNAYQGTSANWAQRRDQDEFNVPCVEHEGDIHHPLRNLTQSHDHIVVDTGGQDSIEFRSALTVADVLITPVKPSQADIETLVFVRDLVVTAREINPALAAKVVFNGVMPSSSKRLLNDARELVGTLDEFDLLDSVIHTRTVYMDALLDGVSATEIRSQKMAGKASVEINSLVDELYKEAP